MQGSEGTLHRFSTIPELNLVSIQVFFFKMKWHSGNNPDLHRRLL